MLHFGLLLVYLAISASSASSGAAAPKKPMELVDRRLRDLVVQQETWFAQEGRYGKNAYRAGLLRKGDSTAFEQVQVEILYAGKIGWSALAAHPAVPGMTCVVFVGNRDRLPVIPRTHKHGRTALLEGIPECDAPRS